MNNSYDTPAEARAALTASGRPGRVEFDLWGRGTSGRFFVVFEARA